MKTIAILLMLLGLFMIVAYGAMYLLGFAMSFDAPGSTTDPKGWMMRILIFLPIPIMLAVLIFSILAFRKEHYGQSVLIGALFAISGIVFFVYTSLQTARVMKMVNHETELRAENERLYPLQTYIRQGEGNPDSILVFPNGIVAFRLYHRPDKFWGGPLGDLNSTRESISFDRRAEEHIKFEDLPHFVDENGSVFTDVYTVK